MKENRDLFETMPVPKAIIKSTLPAIIGMVVVLIYNIADTYFIGQTGNPLQVAAVSLTMPAFLLFMAMGNLLGIGGTSVISRALGAREERRVKNVSSFCFYAAIGVGLFFTLLFLTLMPFILKMIGASSDTAEFANQYLRVVAPSAPFVIMATAFSNILRAEGKAKEAMFGMMIGTITNIVLDPVMIIWMDMQVTGAALATLIGNIVASIYYLHYLTNKKTILSISLKDFTIKNHVLTGVLAIGIPAALNNILMSLANITLNNFLASYGDIHVAAMGVAMKVVLIVVLLQIGLGTGIQPLLGYNFGSGNRKRFFSILKVSIIYTLVLGISLTVVCNLGAGVIVRSFIDSDEVFRYGVRFVHILLIAGPFLGVMFIFVNTLQAIGAGKESLIISISRQGLVFLPTLLIANAVFGLSGIVFAQPIADFCSLVISFFLYRYTMKKVWKPEVVEEAKVVNL